jgi:glycosyltransferase involved in cell wall biosynthesis
MASSKITQRIPTYPTQLNCTRWEESLNRRPRLLFLAHSFPPATAVACVRTWNVAKYLSRLGWDVTVVTPHPSVWRRVEAPEVIDANLRREGIQRILTGYRWRCLLGRYLNCWNQNLGWMVGGMCRKVARGLGVDSHIGWIKAAEQACSTLSANDVDVILASGPPFVAFKLAKRLADRLGRPYVLDYRDPWTGNPHGASHRPAQMQEEARLLSGCAAATIVSHSWGLALDRRFNLGAKLHVITNGYDPEGLADVKPYDFDHFAIVYTGTFYPPKRVISPVMAALKRLKEITHNAGGSTWYFHYFGEEENHVREEARHFGVTDRVVLHGRVPRAEALSAVRSADVAVVITSVTDEATVAERGIMTGKIFDALGLGTPILLIAPPGSDVEAIAQTTELARSFTGNDIDGIASFLQEALSGWALESKNLEAYAWPHLAKRLDTVLREAALGSIPRSEVVF